MGARNGLIALLATLFALQAPLCEVACADGDRAQEIASPSHQAAVPAMHTSGPGAQTMPCHEGGPPVPDGSHERDTHDDCGCEALTRVLSSKVDSLSQLAFASPPVHGLGTLHPDTAKSSRAFAPERIQRIPPPDILLLHSTLLI
jgi:hypothetical protein